MEIMASFMVPVLVTIFLVLVLSRYGHYIQQCIEWVLDRFLALPEDFGGQILPAFGRVIKNNWYTFLMLLLIMVALYLTPVGKDMIISYLDNIRGFRRFNQVFGSLGLLFFATFLLSLVIWILPFYLYNEKRRVEIKSTYRRFYLSTKLLAFLAMGPFVIVTNAFFVHSYPTRYLMHKTLLINVVIFIVFTLIIFLLRKKLLPNWFSPVNQWMHRHIPNGYLVILLKILLWMLGLTCLFSIILLNDYKASTNAVLVFLFMLTASLIVFRLLFYSSQDGEDSDMQIFNLVQNIINPATAHHSKRMYRLLFFGLLALNIFYYLVPSLEATNTLYILLSVFSFFIIYLDYFRNLYNNTEGSRKLAALAATLLFLATPFLTRKEQFRVPYQPLSEAFTARQVSLEQALLDRARFIRQSTGKDTVYLICAMGGGSRAGYITAGTLHALDGIHADSAAGNLWNQTLCYSTISGGSVGAYHYIKGKTAGIAANDTLFFPYLYQKNYNSSGVYGLLLGDPLETLFGSVAITIKKWVTRDNPSNGYFDRNYRVRREYDYVLNEALQDRTPQKNTLIYPQKTFYPWFRKKMQAPDAFKAFFIQHYAKVPVHFVNSFEVNTGRRAILSPFAANNPQQFFPNAVLPLQDKKFDHFATNKDIQYREAVNMSELFPLVSAASYMGNHPTAQMVDGGYYENYGLSSALDVYYFLKRDSTFTHTMKMHVKILLIRNSRQEARYSGRNIQILAPLVGAMNAPFTGHANHLQAETERVLGKEQFYTLTFDAKASNVPLTRALTANHIDSMNLFLNRLRFNDTLMQFLPSRSKQQ